MKFKFNGSLDEFIKKYSEATKLFNKENKALGFELVVYLRAGKIEIGVDRGKDGFGGYWFISPVVEKDGDIEFESEIKPDRDMRMKWFDWVEFVFLSFLLAIPMLIACIFTKSLPFSTKKSREKRLTTYMCKYLGCEKI